MKFLEEHTKQSSMRLNFLLVSIACVIILIAVAVYIVIQAVNKNIGLDWTGMGIFCTGVAAVVTGSAWMKQRQKKDEIKNGTD